MIQSRIGSEFALPLAHLFWKKKGTQKGTLPGVRLSSGRCALTIIAAMLGNREILLPDYLCPDMLEPFAKSIVSFYRVKRNLTVDLHDIKNKVTENTRAILVIHYFGFPQPTEALRNLCRAKNVLLIEDCVQGWLTTINGKRLGCDADVSFTSLRKWMPIPDGALLWIKEGLMYTNIPKINGKGPNSIPLRIIPSFSHITFILQRYALLSANSLLPHPPYAYTNHLEKLNYPKPAPMSVLSLYIAERIDTEYIIRKRRENFLTLLQCLKNKRITPLFSSLDPGICPFGFPIITDNRDELKRYLIKHKIYPPIHWLLKGVGASDDARWLSEHILTLPIDQRYGIGEMRKVAGMLNGY